MELDYIQYNYELMECNQMTLHNTEVPLPSMEQHMAALNFPHHFLIQTDLKSVRHGKTISKMHKIKYLVSNERLLPCVIQYQLPLCNDDM
jgi:hypothetical protein